MMSAERSPIIGSYDSRLVAIFRQIAVTASVLCIVIGVFVLIGWAAHIEFLRSLIPGLTTMNPVSALAFVLLGVALSILAREPVPRSMRVVVNVCIAIVIVTALSRLLGYIWTWNEGVDRLL